MSIGIKDIINKYLSEKEKTKLLGLIGEIKDKDFLNNTFEYFNEKYSKENHLTFKELEEEITGFDIKIMDIVKEYQNQFLERWNFKSRTIGNK